MAATTKWFQCLGRGGNLTDGGSRRIGRKGQVGTSFFKTVFLFLKRNQRNGTVAGGASEVKGEH